MVHDMKFFETISSILKNTKSKKSFQINADSSGLNFFVSKHDFKNLQEADGDDYLLYQFIHLQMLLEQGQASSLPNGFSISTEHAIRLGEEFRALFKLDKRFEGKFSISIAGETFSSSFSLKIIPTRADGREIPNFKLKGGTLQITPEESYLLDEPTWSAFMAVQEHTALPPDQRTEHVNLATIQILQHAKEHGATIDLAHFNDFPIDKATAVHVAAEVAEDGSLRLAPTFNTGHSAQEIASRLGQIRDASNVASLRIGKSIVVLNEQQLRGVREIIENHTIPKHQVREFLKSPQAFLDASLVDLDTGFSLRVRGAVKFVHIPIGATDSKGVDWFNLNNLVAPPEILKGVIKSNEDLEQFRKSLETAQGQGADIIFFDGRNIDISDAPEIERVLQEISDEGFTSPEDVEAGVPDEPEAETERATIEVEQLTACDVLSMAQNSWHSGELDLSVSPRTPFSYQEHGIRWALGLAKASQHPQGNDRIQGALLADDMGLGKTFMTLMTIAQYGQWQKETGKTVKPTLIVAPLSLIETWEAEVEKSFHVSPFRDQVVLLGARDLSKFKLEGAKRETLQSFDQSDVLSEDAIRFALKAGKEFGLHRLDMPGRLVLCTYQTLRDYQFSLSRIDWGIVAFDEAQNIKNPNTLQTRAAKALKADFKLLATGTPVENSLTDFWCLMDTAQPGLLGTWTTFRDAYISPINQAAEDEQDQVRLEIGKKLRDDVGPFMLRRLKSEELDGLPKKRIFTGVMIENKDDWQFDPLLSSTMQGKQLSSYNNTLKDFYVLKEAGQAASKALTALAQLRAISLHPALTSGDNNPVQDPHESAKITCLFNTLQSVKNRNEKVIIFAITKKLQSMLKIWIQKHFGIDAGIINGDTKAVSSSSGAETRKGLIEKFEAKEGFNVIIMSPVAAGVGLTVVGANNVIHLERHWNPAKEAQATDRVYRIGATRDVNIYIPALHHPQHTSFDVLLNKLLMNKVAVSDAVVTPQAVTEMEMTRIFE